MIKRLTSYILLTGCCITANAQGNGSSPGSGSQMSSSFQEFRKSLHKDYQDFRSRILEQYADFLQGEWHPYEPLMAPNRDTTPKPPKAPVKDNKPVPTQPLPEITIPKVKIPVAEIPVPPKPEMPALHDFTLPDKGKSDSPSSPSSSSAGSASSEGSSSGESHPAGDKFDFYGIPVELQRVDFKMMDNVSRQADTAAQWRTLAKNNGSQAAAVIKQCADEMGLNSYLTFRLAEAFLKSRFPRANDAAIISAAHFMLANMGYDVRLAMTGSGAALMLIPFDHTVYGSMYLPIDGRNYTAFSSIDKLNVNYGGETIYTCKLPSDADKGVISDLRLNDLKLPLKPYQFNITGGDITLKGTLNENMMAMLYRYPQMPTEYYAMSVLDPLLHADLIAQVKDQLAGMDELEAVNTLMGFFHQGLPYATDEQRHGFEKPYFIEETLYYDKCDCEDRAIMFTYLLWNALNIPNQLVAYPGHESASVCLKEELPEGGYSYRWEGARWYSADPTYIGSHVGDIMPQFSTVAPTIDRVYNR